MLHLPAALRTPVPWKNGGGVTREVARDPHAGNGDAYDWRVSIAEVASEGPFSRFPKLHRWIAVIRGAGMRLEVEGRAPHLLRLFEPYEFDGDVPAAGWLPAGPVSDLNLIFRPDKVRGSLRFFDTPRRWQAASSGMLLLINVGQSSASCRTNDGALELAVLDAVQLMDGELLEWLTAASYAVIAMSPIQAPLHFRGG